MKEKVESETTLQQTGIMPHGIFVYRVFIEHVRKFCNSTLECIVLSCHFVRKCDSPNLSELAQ